MNLEKLPRYHLSELPTPIHYLASFSKVCNGPSIFMKRDDVTSLGMGGNKTRKLEFLIGDVCIFSSNAFCPKLVVQQKETVC